MPSANPNREISSWKSIALQVILELAIYTGTGRRSRGGYGWLAQSSSLSPFLCRRCSQLYADAGLPALLTVGPARGGKIGNIAGCSYRASLTRRGGVAIVWARHFYLASGRRSAPIWPRCRYRGALRLLFRTIDFRSGAYATVAHRLCADRCRELATPGFKFVMGRIAIRLVLGRAAFNMREGPGHGRSCNESACEDRIESADPSSWLTRTILGSKP